MFVRCFMKKLSNLFKKLSLPLALIFCLSFGGFLTLNLKDGNCKNSSAEFAMQSQISNDLPDYFNIEPSNGSSTGVSFVGDTVYLFQNGSSNNIKIANSIITRNKIEDKNNPNETIIETNYYYMPENNNNGQIYYYFDFASSLSLYYDLTSQDVASGNIGDKQNFLYGKTPENYFKKHDNSFIPSNASFTPKQFNIEFMLNTKNDEITFGETSNDKHIVTLNKEGIYTLVVPIMEYKTTNGGITFEGNLKELYYNFMIFNASTYFDTASGKPQITPSQNIQISNLSSSNDFSTYYFYNFAYARQENTLPTIKFNPERYSLTIEQTNLDQETKEVKLEYQNGRLVALDNLGNEIPNSDNFIRYYLNEENGEKSAVVVFSDIGSYDIAFSYLYTIERNGETTIYNLDLDSLSNNSIFKNKSQRLYIYGYQAMYSDYSDINTVTNQPKSKDIKTYDNEDGYFKSADITSQVNNYISNLKDDAINDTTIKDSLKFTNPSSDNNFDVINLANYTVSAIANGNIQPASTNQTPIKFATNSKNTASSKLYKINGDITKNDKLYNKNDENEFEINKDKFIVEAFQGDNQNSAGKYLYIIQYQYDSFMSTSGTLQSARYHYQIFYFTITNTTPTVDVYDGQLNEVYTNGFTNRNVYILNNSENNIYDAKVEITVSAQNYQDKSYFFKDKLLQELSEFGMAYQKFEQTENGGSLGETFNNKIANKNGILIETTNKFANAHFTIKIKSANSTKPSTRTFTIDTNQINNVTSRNVSLVSSTSYQLRDEFSSFNTNQPFVLSWDEKASGAKTYGYVTFIPTQQINYYSSLNVGEQSTLLNYLNNEGFLPVSYKIDLDSNNRMQWTEYSNSLSYTSSIPSTYVKSSDGFYILEVYDQAGNSTFAIYLIDTSSPIFVQEVDNGSIMRSIFKNNECLPVPPQNTEMSIIWSPQKAILLENIDAILNIKAYQYGVDVENANTKLYELVSEFFKKTNNENIRKPKESITIQKNDQSGINDENGYNCYYLLIDIDEKYYLKDGNSSTFVPVSPTKEEEKFRYKLEFYDNDGNVLFDNKTFKILVRDASNTFFAENEDILYKNHHSGYLSFNVTSDASQMMLKNQNNEVLNFSSFSFTGNLYGIPDKNDDSQNKKIIDYTHISDENYIKTDYKYKFSYYTPTSAKSTSDQLKLYYIPVAENGSQLQSVVLYYYKYEPRFKKYTGSNNYYYYYDLASEPSSKLNIFTASDRQYETGTALEYDLSLEAGKPPLPGKYVFERIYKEDSQNESNTKNDFFKRTLSIIIDNNGLVSKPETVYAKDENGQNITIDGKQVSSLESLVGGDILLSFYSGNNSNIEISFPKYNQNGLNTGSFYSKENFQGNEGIQSVAVSGNKLPLSLYIPTHKYTISSLDTINNGIKEYHSNKNENLSYYGNSRYEYNDQSKMYDVYVEGTVVDSFAYENDAIKFLNTSSIEEYKIYAEVYAQVKENNRTVEKYYCSDYSENNGFLTLYSTTGKDGKVTGSADKNSPVINFYQTGTYIVTLYQASNIGSESKLYNSLYKFGFEITSQAPNFDIKGSDGYLLNSTKESATTYYTNSDSLTVSWQVPTSEYEAKIDESKDKIIVRASNTQLNPTISDIKTEGNTKSFTIDTQNLINSNIKDIYLDITMQYEGFNREYYSTITKRIYFDKVLPSQNLQNLMFLTEQATEQAFTTNYQLMSMRKYFDYKNEEIENITTTTIQTASYTYNISDGYFKYFSFNVSKDFFTDTLVSTLLSASNNPTETQSIYYRYIDNLNSYTQVDKNSFTERNYTQILTDEEIGGLEKGYYEIVEMDYAKNMAVYIVQLSPDSDESTEENAITYSNTISKEDITISNSQIENGFNIYSNSGFEIKDLNYMSDSWEYFTLTRAGEGLLRFMKSPWLEENQIYQLSFSSSGVNFTVKTLSSLFENVNSSKDKHSMVLTDRTTGNFSKILISVMDASLNTQKVEDPTKTSAILNISVPTTAQAMSETTSYVYPTKIIISQFNTTSTSENKWNKIMEANQIVYGTWTPTEEFVSALSFISFKTLTGNTTLQIAINLGANSAQKVRYDIVDNFGNTTTIIQLANEVSYREITGKNAVYELSENDGTITYLSSDTINYTFNTLLYKVKVLNRDGIEVTDDIKSSANSTTNLFTFNFEPTKEFFFDDYYRLIVSDVESENIIKTLHIRLYNKLPFRTTNANEVISGGIIFNDKNQQPIDNSNIGQVPNTSVDFNGKTYYATSENITTYSENVTVRFFNGQSLNYNSKLNYESGYGYSVYISNDGGVTWNNINSATSETSGYTITGVGEYILFVKYDSEDVFTDLCRIFKVSILDSSNSYYYITVDGLNVEKSNVKYTTQDNKTIETNYIVSVDYADKFNRLKITKNEKAHVEISEPIIETTGSNVTVEIYHYSCSESIGDFTIIYIAQTNNIIGSFNYETPTGTTASIKDESSVVIVANKETDTSFDKLKLNFSTYYGIEANKINVEITKLFNGAYVLIDSMIYAGQIDSYVYLNEPGTYRIKIYDSCSPANVQMFKTSKFIDVIFLSHVPFIVTSTNETGETIITEPIQKAVYNSNVTIKPTNLSTYYQPSRMPTISVKRNGKDYTGFVTSNNSYTFKDAGFYTVLFNATSITGVPVRTEEYSFTILNKNESRYAYEFSGYSEYYIEKIEKDGYDITESLIEIANFPTINIDGKTYLSALTINYLDEKTGSGRYKITINLNNKELKNTIGSSFTFEFWINTANPPISVSLPEGEKTTKDIVISFNVQNLYDTVGDCYLLIANLRRDYTADTLSNYGTNERITIKLSGTYYIQLYTASGHLLYSYKVVRTDPLNAFAIIAIVIGVIVVGAVIGITIALRKRQKVK